MYKISIFAVFVCAQFISGFQIDMEMVRLAMRPLLLNLGDYRNLNLNVIQIIASLTQLFPNTFKETLCEQLLVSIMCWLLGPTVNTELYVCVCD